MDKLPDLITNDRPDVGAGALIAPNSPWDVLLRYERSAASMGMGLKDDWILDLPPWGVNLPLVEALCMRVMALEQKCNRLEKRLSALTAPTNLSLGHKSDVAVES